MSPAASGQKPGEPHLILASASPRRCALLEAAGFEFEICPARVEEVNPAFCSPSEIVMWNAVKKAREVSARFPRAVVIGADTLVACAGRVLGKPVNLRDARSMLKFLRGRTHQVFTAVAIMRGEPMFKNGFIDSAAVQFRKLNDAEISMYMEDVNPLDKAGAYGAQETSRVRLVERIDGTADTVYGLPINPLRALLKPMLG